jgi:hypothetical protein
MYSRDLISLNSVTNYHAVLVYPLYELKKTQVKVTVTFSRLYKRYPVFTIHRSVHRTNIPIYIQQDATLYSLFYLETALHVSGGTSTHRQQRIQLYLQHLVFVTPLLLPAAIVAGSSNGLMMDKGTVWKHVVFHFKNKFVKLVHLVGFIIRNPTRTESSNILLICKLKLYHILKQDLHQA